MSTRMPKQELYMGVAKLLAKQTTCIRRGVGCVLLDHDWHVLATGYNGVPSGFPHCTEGNECEAAKSQSGRNLEFCNAVHAEQNALIQCTNPGKIAFCVTTTFPCLFCIRMLLNTPCKTIFYSETYSQPGAASLWRDAGRTMEQIR